MGCEVCKEPEQAKVQGSNSATPVPAPSPSEEILKFLTKVQLFKRLPSDQIPVLAAACSSEQYPQNHVLIKQGDDGDAFFVIVSGTVRVMIDENKVATLTTGDYVGENALLRNEPRSATIIAETPISVLKITRENFREMGLNEKLEFPKRQAVAGGCEANVVTKPPCAKTSADRKFISEAIKRNQNLNTMMEVTDEKIAHMIEVMWTEQVLAGKDIITQGELEADYFYIVKDGCFEIFVNTSDKVQSADQAIGSHTERVGEVPTGGSFGELAMLYYAPRAATVRAKTTSVVYVIDRVNFKNTLSKTSADFAKEYRKYLEKVEILQELKPDEMDEVAKSLVETDFSAGETIFEQGEKGDTFYILYEGEVSIIKSGKVMAEFKATKDKAECFGEMALLSDKPRMATVKVLSQTAKTLALDKNSFDLLLGPLDEIRKRGKNVGESKVGTLNRKASTEAVGAVGSRREKIYRKDLQRLGLLGCGGFGAVELVEHVVTKETYALKALSKGYVVKCGMKKGVMSEKNIQYMCDSPFVVKLYETYNGEQSLYFLLELALGGELYATYNKKGFHGREEHAKFYVAGTVYAFEHLHDKKIIYRDLKPENLLLTDSGCVKLTDMGLAKVVVGKTYTTCGTPDYFAPEMIASSGHTNAVDWWTLGILSFELMAGHPPFEAAAPMQIYSKVTKGINKVSFPSKLKGPCESLVKNLCSSNPTERLPMKKGGIENIKNHQWFNEFDWVGMKNLTLEPPYKPKVKSRKDIANFAARKEDMPPQVKYNDDGSGWDADFATSK